MKKQIFFLLTCLGLASTSVWADLSGRWRADDGGIYYISQVGNRLYWYGEARRWKPQWANVFSGHIRGGNIRGSWADVPKGDARRSGTLELVIRRGGEVLRAVRKSGGFGGSRWTRLDYDGGRPPPPPPPPRQDDRYDDRDQGYNDRRPAGEDCVSFNPNTTRMRNIRGRWKIVDGSHWIADFGHNRREASQALRVIKRYRIDQSCFVGRPNPSFKYLLTRGNAPSGRMGGEDCVGFNPRNVRIARINGNWKVVDGSHWLFDFGRNLREARQAIRVIRRYNFRWSCFVGRPNPSFEYLRR